MKKIFAILSFVALWVNAGAQSVNTMLTEAQRLENLPNEPAALNKYKEVLGIEPANILAVSKCSELYSRIGTRQPTPAQKEKYYTIALTYAKNGLAIAPNDDRTNVSMAIALGKSSLNKSGKDKLKSAREIKLLVERAIKTNPSNFLAWHILGRWNYEIGNLSFVERTAAKIMYGSVPEGSNNKAIMFMEKAHTLSPAFILNNLELAKAYLRDGNKSKALILLSGISKLPISTEDDGLYKQQAATLANSLS